MTIREVLKKIQGKGNEYRSSAAAGATVRGRGRPAPSENRQCTVIFGHGVMRGSDATVAADHGG